MPARIVFRSIPLATVFQNSTDGIGNIKTEGGESVSAASLQRIEDAIGEVIASHPDTGVVITVDVADEDLTEAKAVLENCFDVSTGYTREDDPDCRQFLFEGDAHFILEDGSTLSTLTELAGTPE